MSGVDHQGGPVRGSAFYDRSLLDEYLAHRHRPVTDYFVPGPRTREWFGRPVTWHHRTVEQYVSLLADSGFAIIGLREGEPVESLFDGDQSEYDRRRRVPVFLVLNATRTG